MPKRGWLGDRDASGGRYNLAGPLLRIVALFLTIADSILIKPESLFTLPAQYHPNQINSIPLLLTLFYTKFSALSSAPPVNRSNDLGSVFDDKSAIEFSLFVVDEYVGAKVGADFWNFSAAGDDFFTSLARIFFPTIVHQAVLKTEQLKHSERLGNATTGSTKRVVDGN